MGKMRNADSTPLSGIAGLIEQLSRSLVLAEPDDFPALAQIHTMFCDAAQGAEENGAARLGAAARKTADLVERIILCEEANPAAALEAVNRAAAILQAVALQGQDVATVKFPPELKLDEAAPGAGGARACACDYTIPANVDRDIFAEFITRQSAALEEFEGAVLAIEKTPDAQKLTQLKRVLHTLKGEAALLGLKLIEQVCHETEGALARRNPALMADCLLVVRDWLDQALKAYAGKGPHPRSPEYFLEMLAGEPGAGAGSAPAPFAAPDEKPAPAPAMPLEGDVALIGDFINESKEHLEAVDVALLDLETDSQDMESINALFRRFHTIKGVAGFLGLEHVRALSHESESLLDRARKGEILLAGSAIDVIFDAADALKAMINAIQCSITSGNPIPENEELPRLLRRIQAAAAGAVADENVAPIAPERAGGRRLGEILVETGVASKENVETALNRQNHSPESPRLGEILVREGQAAARDVAHALRAQKVSSAGQTVLVKETVKVDADRLDRLVEMIGELVIAESMVSQSGEVREAASAPLLRHLNQLDKITRELQEMGTSLRMVPLRTTFQKMARLVRDLSKKFGKQVDFVMAGEDTELDKTVVDKIGDPLVHMIRNAVDHGLEASEAERVAAGKAPAGRVELRAFHKGGNIYIEIHDDGKGLDRKAIIAKAIERGLIRDGEGLSDREVYNLIFQPGFSTAKVVTDVSGRGVGMDVVKRNIDALRGQVDITSEVGRGTTFSIRLPLTLAIIDGMVIRVGSERYIIPTLSIIRSIRSRASELSSILGRGEMLSVHGKLLPLFRLDRLFSIDDAEQEATRSIAVIVEDEGRQIGLLIDELLGQQQIVIKSLGESMRGIPGISGGAIMPDGQVGLILDVGGLVRLAHMKTNLNPADAGQEAEASLAAAGSRN